MNVTIRIQLHASNVLCRQMFYTEHRRDKADFMDGTPFTIPCTTCILNPKQMCAGKYCPALIRFLQKLCCILHPDQLIN